MNNPQIWITPLALLPGVALLILSTSTRFGQLHEEIHHFQDSEEKIPSHLIERAKYFKDALSLLYASVVFFSLAAFFGGVSEFLFIDIIILVGILLCFGIVAVVIASFFLYKESRTAFKIIEHHIRKSNQ